MRLGPIGRHVLAAWRGAVGSAALAAKIVERPTQLGRSLTWDQGKKMAAHARFSMQTGVPVYFCGPAQSVAARQQRERQHHKHSTKRSPMPGIHPSARCR
jgi:hypothetical protein